LILSPEICLRQNLLNLHPTGLQRYAWPGANGHKPYFNKKRISSPESCSSIAQEEADMITRRNSTSSASRPVSVGHAEMLTGYGSVAG
jgi:hypothetical protein